MRLGTLKNNTIFPELHMKGGNANKTRGACVGNGMGRGLAYKRNTLPLFCGFSLRAGGMGRVGLAGINGFAKVPAGSPAPDIDRGKRKIIKWFD